MVVGVPVETSTPSAAAELRVAVVARDSLARAGLAALLANQPGLAVIGQTPTHAGLLDEMEVYHPDVVLWDLGWDPPASMDGLAELREAGLPVVALLPDEAYASQAVAAGARGLLLRDTDGSTLATALRSVALGLLVLAPELATVVPPAQGRSSVPPVEALTPRELEVLRLLAQGLPNKTISQKLGISEHTVKFHVNAILGKLGAQSRTEAVVLATRLGLVLL